MSEKKRVIVETRDACGATRHTYEHDERAQRACNAWNGYRVDIHGGEFTCQDWPHELPS